MLPLSWKGEIEKTLYEAASSNNEKWNSAVDQQNTSNASIASQINFFAEHFRAYKQQQNTDDRKERTLNKITIILVFLTVLFTGGSWWEFRGQLDEMRKASEQTEKLIGTNSGLAEAAKQQAQAADKQANAAIDAVRASREAMIASERAWVGPANAKADGPPITTKPLDVVVEYKNTGREPALNAVYDLQHKIGRLDDPDLLNEMSKFIEQCKMMWHPNQAQVIYPMTNNEYNLSHQIDASEINDDVVSGENVILVYGCFSYETIQTIHRSWYCYYFKSGVTKPQNWNICATGNGAD
jgi:hypothetical protein